MLNVNGPGFKGLYAGDSIEFRIPVKAGARGMQHVSFRLARGTVRQLLVFEDHVVVSSKTHDMAVVYAGNFVRLVRRGKRHIEADAAAAYAKFEETADERLRVVL